ncbi:MAG: hypothetical protein WB699_01140, partial [Bacteroidota bacterium]
GYDKAAEVAKKAMREHKAVKDVVVELGYLTKAEAVKILDPAHMTQPGVSKKTGERNAH